jgi:hypothetical protein
MELRIPPSRLERRIRLLLHAYPPPYRADRGEEMLGTLLEATPDDRDWPSARDSWSLLAGGTRARRAGNRQPGPAASLRQAVVLGLALYLSWESAQFFLGWESAQFFMHGLLTRAHGTPVLAGFLLAAAALAVWAGHRTLTVTTVAAGFAVLAFHWYADWPGAGVHDHLFQSMVLELMTAGPLLLAMLALAHLARRDGRPPRSWLILACAPLLAVLVTRALPVLLRPGPAPGVLRNLLPDIFLLLAIPALAWLATDARPALGVAVALVVSEAYALATTVPSQAEVITGSAGHETVVSIVPGVSVWQWGNMDVEKLALAVVMTVATAWMLRRRTRPHPR